jgi:Ca-activated chloride channel family protein
MLTFEDPYYLYLFFLLPFIVVYRFFFYRSGTVVFSTIQLFPQNKLRERIFQYICFLLRSIAIIFVVFALARPQVHQVDETLKTEGVDIVLVLDISRSMLAEDIQPANRLEIAKEEAHKFIKKRPHDRIGLVIFAHNAITQCPLTLDHNVLIRLLNEVQVGKLKVDGTAIGIALGTAINRLIDSSSKSKVIILLTDGENNAGQIDPITAADLAHKFGIRIYTIGIGKGGKVPFPKDDPIAGRSYIYTEVRIDEATLSEIAKRTNGHYFRAFDQGGLQYIYSQIDSLEKSEIDMTSMTTDFDVFHFFLIGFIVVFLFEILLTRTFFLTLP